MIAIKIRFGIPGGFFLWGIESHNHTVFFCSIVTETLVQKIMTTYIHATYESN